MTRAGRAVRGMTLGGAVVAVALGPGPGPLGPAPAAAQDVGAERTEATVDSLLERGRLQEAAWALREAGDTARAEEVLARLETILTSWPVDASPADMDSQGVSYTWRLRHGDGVRSIFKVEGSDIFCPECGVDREVASYRIDAILDVDLTPMTVFARITNPAGDTLSGSAQYFMVGAELPESGATKPDALRFFDAVIGNSDRHPENWLIVAGRVVAIDHNRAFEYQPTTRAATCWETEVDSIARPADLGRPWDRYRTLPADSFEAALAGTDTALARRFLAMRDEIIDRVRARIEEPDAQLPLTDCEIP
ncbi:MAG: hypothetical protein ACN0LA_07400 [Candidatus Longimicrobiales bacterium M2_2A_002]